MPELRIFKISAKIWVDEATAEGSMLQQIEKEQCVWVANVEQVLRLPPVLKVNYVRSEGRIVQQSLVGQVCNEAQDNSHQQSKEIMSTLTIQEMRGAVWCIDDTHNTGNRDLRAIRRILARAQSGAEGRSRLRA